METSFTKKVVGSDSDESNESECSDSSSSTRKSDEIKLTNPGNLTKRVSDVQIPKHNESNENGSEKSKMPEENEKSFHDDGFNNASPKKSDSSIIDPNTDVLSNAGDLLNDADETSTDINAKTKAMSKQPTDFEKIQLLLQKYEKNVLKAISNSNVSCSSQIDDVETRLNARLDTIESKICGQENLTPATHTIPDGFPIQNLEDFETFEKSQLMQNQLKNYLVWWGGTDVKATVRQYMKDALSDEAAAHFKWCQASSDENEDENKKTLFNTKLSRTMFSAIRTTFPTVTIDKFHEAMQSALRAAKQRNRDRVRRHRRRQETGGGALQRLQQFLEEQ